MSSPFAIDGPAVISFSGGRTSGFMLRRILDEGLRPDVYVVFANTGKERVETLNFVHEIETRWSVPVSWVEFDPVKIYRVVSHDTASRDGEPFNALIAKKSRLPNAMIRMCTEFLKVRPMQAFNREVLGLTEWTSVVGIRHDEPRRWRILGQDPRSPHVIKIAPLVDAKVSERDVMAFWAAQPFDLRLKTHEGNCDLCFMKGILKREAIIRNNPELAEWWAKHEDQSGHVFRRDTPSYRQLLQMSTRQAQLFDNHEDDPTDAMECLCHD